MKRIHVLGDRPGPRTDPKRPLYPHTTVGAAANLARLMGLSREEYLANVSATNVWHDGHEILSRHEAIPRLDGLWAWFQQEEPVTFLVVVLGQRALEACPKDIRAAADFQPWATTYEFLDNVRTCYVPHTSGVNRVWNDAQLKEQTRCRLSSLVTPYLRIPRSESA